MILDPIYLPHALAGVSMLVLAALLFYIGPGRQPNRALAIPLTLHGVMSILFMAVAAAEDPRNADFLTRVRPYFWLPLAPSFVYFASVFPQRPGRRLGSRGRATFALLIICLPAAYLIDPTWFTGVGGTVDGLQIGRGGPLRLAAWVFLASYGLLAFAYLRAYLKRTPDSRPPDLLILSLAFALIHLHDAFYFAGPLGRAALDGSADWRAYAVVAWNVASYVPLLMLLAFSAGRLRNLAVPTAIGAAVASGVLTAAVHVAAPAAGARLHVVVGGLWDLTFPVLLTYAVLKHQLLGIDVKIRWTISKGTLAGIFVAVFFIASEAAQEFFGATLGSNYVGIMAAGALVFAMAPLSRFADRVAHRAVPLAGGASLADRREATFQEAVRYTLRDRRMSPDEELFLARLAEDLGLGAEQATRLRQKFEENEVA